MTRSIRGSRRAALLLAGTAATGLLVSGCGTGQIAETANKQPSVQGVNVQTPDNAYKVRGLYVEYPGPGGYQAGANAPLNAVIYNDSPNPVTVTVTTDSAREVVIASSSAGASAAASASPSESALPPEPASPSDSASPSESESPAASPSAPAGEPARVDIPAFGYVQLNVSGGRFLQLVGLHQRRLVGESVNLVFDFGNGKTIRTVAAIGVPLTPAPQPSPIIEREGAHGEESDSGSHGE